MRKPAKRSRLNASEKLGDGQKQKMTLKEVLSVALTYVGMDADILDEENALQDEDVKLLIKCTGFAIDEISSEYLPIACFEEVESDGKKLRYSDFSNMPLRVKKVGRDGKSVPFRARPGYIEVKEDGVFGVEYTCLPAHPSAFTDAIVLAYPVPVKTVALGVASQYCLITGRYEQSTVLSGMFTEDMRTNARPYRSFDWKR